MQRVEHCPHKAGGILETLLARRIVLGKGEDFGCWLKPLFAMAHILPGFRGKLDRNSGMMKS